MFGLRLAAILAGLALLGACTPPSSEASRLSEPLSSDIGYPSPQAALAALRQKPGVKFRSYDDGWVDALDPTGRFGVWWTFPPDSDPAYPSAMRREMIVDGAKVFVDQRIMCVPVRPACGRVFQRGLAMNDALMKYLQQQPGFLPASGTHM